MSWLPRIGLFRVDPVPGLNGLGDYEGRALVIAWGRWIVDITIARRRA